MNQREKDLGPNDAPCWYSSDEASAWACGAEYGRRTALEDLDLDERTAYENGVCEGKRRGLTKLERLLRADWKLHLFHGGVWLTSPDEDGEGYCGATLAEALEQVEETP